MMERLGLALFDRPRACNRKFQGRPAQSVARLGLGRAG